MAYRTTFDINGQTGTIGFIRYGDPLAFSQLFDGIPQYYPGSIIQVQEILTIITRIADASVVDVDLDWFDPKKYLGTYQVIDFDGVTSHAEGDDGYLVGTYQKIKRYSWYTIAANPNVPIALDEGFIVNDCNFYSVAEVYLFPGTNTPLPGFRLRESGEGKPLLRGYTSRTAAPLADTDFNARIGGVGLHLKPGVEGVRIEYAVSIINDIYTDYEPFPVSTCELVQPTCEEQYAAYLSGGGEAFATFAACESARLNPPPNSPPNDTAGVCVPDLWICPTDPTFTRESYTIQYGN
jgi:hypothetical protein